MLKPGNDDTETASSVAAGPSVRVSAALSFAARMTVSIVTLVSSMILARLLTPAETGIYAVGLAVMTLLQVLREFGVGSYLIQERELTRQKIRAAFTVTLLLAWSLGGVLAAASPPLVAYYGEPALAQVLLVLSLGFIFLPFGTPTMGLLRREMRFGALFWINVGASVATAVVAVTLAWLDFGPVSLAWGGVAGSATTSVLALFCRPSDALLIPTLSGLRPVLRFGGQTAAASTIVQIAQTATPLLIGRMLGFADTGLYSRANNLLIAMRGNVMGALANVAQPAFADRARENGALREPFLRASALMTGITWPMQAFFIIMAFPLFRLLFGPQWDEAVPLFRLLLIGDAAFSLLPFASPVLFAIGRPEVYLRGEVIIQGVRLIFIALAALHSIEAVCVAEALHYFAYFIVYSNILLPLIAVRKRELILCHAKSVLVTISCISPVIMAFRVLDARIWHETELFLLSAAASLATLGWLFGIFASRHPLSIEVKRIFCHLRRKAEIHSV